MLMRGEEKVKATMYSAILHMYARIQDFDTLQMLVADIREYSVHVKMNTLVVRAAPAGPPKPQAMLVAAEQAAARIGIHWGPYTWCTLSSGKRSCMQTRAPGWLMPLALPAVRVVEPARKAVDLAWTLSSSAYSKMPTCEQDLMYACFCCCCCCCCCVQDSQSYLGPEHMPQLPGAGG